MMWTVLSLVLLVIGVVWWLLTRNASHSQKEVANLVSKHSDHHDIAAEEISTSVKVSEPAASAVRSEDDLTLIEGIGPKIDKILKEAGIITFSQLAEKSPEEIKDILNRAGLRLGDPTSWPEQASLAAQGDWEGLKKLQESLKAGRIVKKG